MPSPPGPCLVPRRQLWVALILTCLAVGLIVWAAERWAWIRQPPDVDELPDLEERMWGALGATQVRRAGRRFLSFCHPARCWVGCRRPRAACRKGGRRHACLGERCCRGPAGPAPV